MSKPRKHPPRPRTSVPLTGSIVNVTARLDADSYLAIDYGQAWLQRAYRASGKTPLRVTSSATIRRALAAYMSHLAALRTDDPAAILREVRLAEAASQARSRDPSEHLNAQLRLHGMDPAEPLPPFNVIRDGSRVVAERAALHERLNRILEQ
jgi:hypothetical protein